MSLRKLSKFSVHVKNSIKFFKIHQITSAAFYHEVKSSLSDNTVFNLSLENKSMKRIPLTKEDFKVLKQPPAFQPENPHLLKVSILGEPNAGKSTLTNSLVKWKVCAVSRKVHTTRKKISAVLVEDNKQIVFLDTPGFVTPEITRKHSLEPSFVMDPISSIREADIIAVVLDITNRYTNNRISSEILEVLEDFKEKKSILILNKIDAMKSKDRLLHLTRILTGGMVDGCRFPSAVTSKDKKVKNVAKLKPTESTENAEQSQDLRGWNKFSRVFMVSALKNSGVDDLRDYLLSEARPHNWVYKDSLVTDQSPQDIALTIVREKLLEYLPEEIPYLLGLRVAKWEILTTGCPKIDIKIECANDRHKRFVIGPGGKHIAVCVEKSRKAMRESFRKDVVLHIAVV